MKKQRVSKKRVEQKQTRIIYRMLDRSGKEFVVVRA